MAYWAKTPITAAVGTAIINPKKPSKTPPESNANITHMGCKPTLSPTSFGVKKLPSINWPTANTATTYKTGVRLEN